MRLLTPTSGTARIDGQDVFAADRADLKRLRRHVQFIFQDPVGSLNPRMPVSDIIGEGLVAQADDENQWAKRPVRDKRVGDYLEIVGLRRDYARRYPHEFSGGQRQRIGIARALAIGPQFVICDEPVSALDVSIQSQILNLLLDLRRDLGLTFLFIAHNLSVVQYISDRVAVMYLGKIVEIGPVGGLYEGPRHPYSIALLSAVPEPDPRLRKRRIVLRGDVPAPPIRRRAAVSGPAAGSGSSSATPSTARPTSRRCDTSAVGTSRPAISRSVSAVVSRRRSRSSPCRPDRRGRGYDEEHRRRAAGAADARTAAV